MTDMVSLALDIQRQALAAQKAQMDLAQRMLDAGRQVAAAQEMTAKAAEANLRTIDAWAKLWGMR